MAVAESTAAIISGLATAGASLGAGVMNSMGQANANKKGVKLAHEQMDWNERMMQQQNEAQMRMTKELRDEDREYSSPSAQLQRLRDAGLNPLFYNLDGTGNGVMPQPSAASANAASMPHIDNALQGVSSGLSQAAVTAAQVANINADTKKKEAETEFQQTLNEIQTATKDNQIELSGIKVEFDKGSIEKQQSEIAKVKVETSHFEAEMDKWLKELSNADRSLSQKDQELILQKAAQELERELTEAKLSVQEKEIAVAFYNAKVNESGVVANNAYLELQGERVRISNARDAAQFEADKPFMKANNYIDTAGRVVGMVTDVAGLAIRSALGTAMVKSRRTDTNKVHKTYNQDSQGNVTRSADWYEYKNPMQ